GLLTPFDHIAHRDYAEACDPHDQSEGKVRLEQVEHAHRRLQDRIDKRLDVQRDELVLEEIPFEVMSGTRHIGAGANVEVEQARGLDPEVRLDRGRGDPEALGELLVQDADDPHVSGRAGHVAEVEDVVQAGGETAEVRTDTVRDDSAVDGGGAGFGL